LEYQVVLQALTQLPTSFVINKSKMMQDNIRKINEIDL
jgi:hypothetical protein